MKWAIYSKELDTPVWLSENAQDLMGSMAELNRSLGDRFYLAEYPLKESESPILAP